MFDALQSWDLALLTWIRTFKDPVLVWLAWAAATVAWKGWLWWATIVGSWFRGQRTFSVQLTVALILCSTIGLSLKGLFLRPRPDLYASVQLNIPMQELFASAHSFPSGHTLLSAAFAFVVLKFYKDYRAWLAFAFVVAVGTARVYQGLHWPTDVIGSVLLGALAAYVAGLICNIPIIRRILQYQALKPPVSITWYPAKPDNSLPANEDTELVAGGKR